MLNDKGYDFEWVKNKVFSTQNIVSSFAAYDILPSTYWVSASTYLTAMDQFKQPHKLRINIVGPRQKLVPSYSGHLNFLASKK